jgi:hypothetical protein
MRLYAVPMTAFTGDDEDDEGEFDMDGGEQ